MSKKAVFIHGSPRKNGTTRALAQSAKAALEEAGVLCDWIDAASLDFKHPGCIACYKCQRSPDYGCHVRDGLAQAVNSLPGYDAIVLATPIYWHTQPAQMKMLIDRMFSLIKFDENHTFFSPLKGKSLGLLATGGGVPAGNLELLEAQWRTASTNIGLQFLSCLFPHCPPEADAAKTPERLADAHKFGTKLARLPGA